MSMRVSKVGRDLSSSPARSRRPDRWRWWWQRPAGQELTARDASDLVNEFGEDAYWLARTCERQSPSEPSRHHWHVVATEIERHTARTSAAMPDTRKTAGSPRAAYGRHFATRNAGLPRHDAYRAGAPAGLDDEHSQSQGCYHRALRIAAAKEYDQHHEDRPRYAGAAPAERNHGGNFERGDTTGLRVEEMHDDSPRKNRRSGIVTMLVLIGWATVGTAGAYVSRTYYFGAQTSAALYQAKPAKPAVRGDVWSVAPLRGGHGP